MWLLPTPAPGQVQNSNLPQPGLALPYDEWSRERVGGVHLDAWGRCGQHLGPGLADAVDGGAHQPEVRLLVVGRDEELVAVVAHRILDAGATRLDGGGRFWLAARRSRTAPRRRVARQSQEEPVVASGRGLMSRKNDSSASTRRAVPAGSAATGSARSRPTTRWSTSRRTKRSSSTSPAPGATPTS